MYSVYKKAPRTSLPVVFITFAFLLPLSVWPDIIGESLPQADAEGLLFITTFEPETGEYLLVQCDLESQTERAVARGLGRFKDATVSLSGKRLFFAGNLKDEKEFKIYIMERATVNDEFKIASEILISENVSFKNFAYDDWRAKLYVNYSVPVEGTL